MTNSPSLTPRQIEDERPRTAYHEAGHAVMAVFTNQLIGQVNIIPSGDQLGFCGQPSTIRLYRGQLRTVALRRAIETELRREALLTLAALAGEAILDDWNFTTDDIELTAHREEVVLLAEEFDVTDPEAFLGEAVLALGWFFEQAPVRRAVQAVAEQLLAKETLMVDEVHRIVEAVVTPQEFRRLVRAAFSFELSEATCQDCGDSLWWAPPKRRYCSFRCQSRARTQRRKMRQQMTEPLGSGAKKEHPR